MTTTTPGATAMTQHDEGPLPRVLGAAPTAAALANGQPVLLVDEDAVWPAHMVVAASCCGADEVTFMARFARGIVGLAMTAGRCDQLGLRAQRQVERDVGGLRYTVSVEARDGVTTGISAADRARTIAVAVDPASGPLDLVVPGHVFPIRADPDGIAGHQGPTEAAIALTILADAGTSAVVCAVLDEDGEIALRPYLRTLAARFDLPVTSIQQVIRAATA